MIRAYGSFILGLAAIGIGCGGAATPHTAMTASASAIRAAEEVGARDEPRAALHLTMAREQHGQALELVRKGDNEDAARLLGRAQADAELAVALAKEAQTKANAERTLAEVRELRSRL